MLRELLGSMERATVDDAIVPVRPRHKVSVVLLRPVLSTPISPLIDPENTS